jgi:hypothetical protein
MMVWGLSGWRGGAMCQWRRVRVRVREEFPSIHWLQLVINQPWQNRWLPTPLCSFYPSLNSHFLPASMVVNWLFESWMLFVVAGEETVVVIVVDLLDWLVDWSPATLPT